MLTISWIDVESSISVIFFHQYVQ